MTKLCPGSDGEPLPASTLVFRIGKRVHLNSQALARREVLEIFFKPSSEDEESPGQRLSIWAEDLTLPDQAWDFTGRDPAKTVVACLSVAAIRSIEPPDQFEPLEVEWEQALLPDGSRNAKPGAEGHCGISGLLQGGKRDKLRRKELRSRLADKAYVSPVPVPHDIPEEHLRVAAYFIHENSKMPEGTSEMHWIRAVRQLRRARVKEHKESGYPGTESLNS
jgi:DUF2934 family protein